MYSRRTDPHSCHIVKFYDLVMKSTTSREVPTDAGGCEKIWSEEKGWEFEGV